MSEASATAAPPPAPAATTPETPTAASVGRDGYQNLSTDLDTILSGSDLGKPESEQRVADTKRGRRGTQNPPRAPAVGKPAAGADKTAEASTTKTGSTDAESAKAVGNSGDETATGSEVKTPEQLAAAATGKPAEKALGPWQRVHAAERQVKELETKLAEFESRPKTDDPEKLEWVKRYEDLDKRYQEKENHIRYKDYEASDDYVKNFKQPYIEKYQQAAAEISELRVPNPDGTFRAATEDDFWKIVTIPNTEDALAAAEELFGSATKANFVIGLRKEVRALNAAGEKAKAEFRKTGVAKQQEQAKLKEAQEKVEYEQAVAQWDNLNKGALEKYPDWFTAPDDDEKGKEFLKIGYENVDKALGAENGMPKEEILARRAAVRNQAGAFRYMVHKWEATKNRVAELEKELAAFKESEPGKGTAAGGKGVAVDDAHASIDAGIARLAGR